jgi:hypothetical protein
MAAAPGALRFNTDSLKMELFDGNQWVEIVASSPDSQTGGARGVFGGGNTVAGPAVNNIEYITISTTGNALDFGDLTSSRGGMGGVASNTRGVFAGGYNPSPTPATRFTAIDKITISSTGNSASFGSLSGGRNSISSCSNSARGVFAGGYQPTRINVIEYITIASDGNPVDFGDLSTNTRAGGFSGGCASSTRGLFALGSTSGGIANTIEFITISTLGNSADFGDLTVSRAPTSCSNAVRGLFAGGVISSPSLSSTIDYVTIATLGNAVDFGDITTSATNISSCASSTRGVFAGGTLGPSNTNTVEYVQIMSTGNSIDFGDISSQLEAVAGLSNGHGGL